MDSQQKYEETINYEYNFNNKKIEFPSLINAPDHYDNTNGSLYKWCEEKGLNNYEFDIIKRVMRCRKKGQFEEDLKKTIELIKLYLNERA